MSKQESREQICDVHVVIELALRKAKKGLNSSVRPFSAWCCLSVSVLDWYLLTFGLLESSFDRHGELGRLPEEKYFACEVRIETIENMGQERGIVRERGT